MSSEQNELAADSGEHPMPPQANLEMDGQNVSRDEQDSSKPREQTRSKVALLFVLGFFAILFLCFAYGVKVNASLSELKDVLIGIIGALSGTLGFIIGFYYKSLKEQ